jgi:excisionase family DNA binding protein
VSYNKAMWLTVKEGADYLRVHPQTLRRWIKAGKVRVYRINRRIIRFRKEDLDSFIEREGRSSRGRKPSRFLDTLLAGGGRI